MGIRWAKMDKICDKMRQDGAEMEKARAKRIPRWLQEDPRWPHEGPRWPREGPRWPQERSKRAQDDAKMAQDRARYADLRLRKPSVKNLRQPMKIRVFEGFRSIGGGLNEAKTGLRPAELG